MQLGYNTNGFAHHRLTDALALIAEIGYQCAAITLDHHALNPFAAGLDAEISAVHDVLSSHNMTNVIETGARYLLDVRRKHRPTLLCDDSLDRQRRLGFLKAAVDVAVRLESQCISIWSGAPPNQVHQDTVWQRLVMGLRELCDYASDHDVTVAFEPEPGMFVDTLDKYAELVERLDRPLLRLTMDLGHLHCMREVPIGDKIRRWADQIANIHIEDMRSGVHEHLMFGEGEMDFGSIVESLREMGYGGPVTVELSRHSHMAPEAARQSFDFLTRHLS